MKLREGRVGHPRGWQGRLDALYHLIVKCLGP